MAVLKVRDLAFARLQSPDLDAQEEFLTAFGMVPQTAAIAGCALASNGTRIDERAFPYGQTIRQCGCSERNAKSA
jgi:hypothetical protein